MRNGLSLGDYPLNGDDLLVLIRAVDLLDAAARLAGVPFSEPNESLIKQLNKIRTRLVHSYGYEAHSPPSQRLPTDSGSSSIHPLSGANTKTLPAGSEGVIIAGEISR